MRPVRFKPYSWMSVKRILFLQYRLKRARHWRQPIAIERLQSALDNCIVTSVSLCPCVNHLRLRLLLILVFLVQIDIWQFNFVDLSPLVPVQI
jgi:hypothetical protein